MRYTREASTDRTSIRVGNYLSMTDNLGYYRWFFIQSIQYNCSQSDKYLTLTCEVSAKYKSAFPTSAINHSNCDRHSAYSFSPPLQKAVNIVHYCSHAGRLQLIANNEQRKREHEKRLTKEWWSEKTIPNTWKGNIVEFLLLLFKFEDNSERIPDSHQDGTASN